MSIYENITNLIIEKLKSGVIPWHQPWTTSFPKNMVSGKEYRGINLLILGLSTHTSPFWVTYKQALKLKGNVRRGSKGMRIVFWDMRKVNDEDDKERVIPFLKSYVVFNLEQTEGILAPESDKPEIEPLEACESLIQGMPNRPEFHMGGNVACYIPKTDVIRMPNKDAFVSSEDYYSTLFHESVHSTGHVSRLNRKGVEDVSPYGSENYSKEELVAELGASFLSGITGIEGKTLSNNAAYIGGWLKALKNDKKFVLQAASLAQKGVDFIRGEYQ